jgi:hypothetical protein
VGREDDLARVVGLLEVLGYGTGHRSAAVAAVEYVISRGAWGGEKFALNSALD